MGAVSVFIAAARARIVKATGPIGRTSTDERTFASVRLFAGSGKVSK